jgi:alpha-L-rhamnosidase
VNIYVRILVWAGLLLTLATASTLAQVAHEAKITQATSVSLGSSQIPLAAGTMVKVLSLQGTKATISVLGSDGTPIIAQISANLLADVAATNTAALQEAPSPPLPAAKPTGLTPAKLRCEYRVDPLGIDSAAPRLDWILQAADPLARGLSQSAYEVVVASTPDLLARDQGDLWHSGKVTSNQMSQISYGGKALTSNQACWWKVRVWDQDGKASAWSDAAQWTMGILNIDDWQSAKWIGAPDANQPDDHKGAKPKYETVLLRREIKVKPNLRRAVVNVCGLGQYEMTLNGSKIGNEVLSPGWTRYDKTCLYDTYDVTSSLHSGTNAVGLFLGNGFYNIHGQRYTKIQCSFGPVQAIALIRLEYENGSVENIVTDDQWKTNSGPIIFSSIYGGEDYDARLAQDGWDKPGFNDSNWDQPALTQGPGGTLKGLSCAGPPIHIFDVLTPVSNKEVSPGVVVYDLGQNASLLLRLKVKGAAGSSVKVTLSETINSQGDIQDDMTGGNSFWTYTLSGSGDENYLSKFYYRGGRYMKVELRAAPGSGDRPEIESIEGDTIHADAPAVGQFSCSNELFNKIYTMTRWSQLNNMMSVMTDCPSREKLGWLEEDHLNGPALRYNFDLSTLFAKMLNDMADSQRPDGLVPSTCPDFPRWDGNGMYTNPPEWGSACIAVPWQQYLFDGDVELLRQRYDMMKRYVDYLGAKANDSILNFGLGDWYDNHGFGAATLTPVALTATAFYYYDTHTLGQVATLLGEADDAAKYQKQSEQVLTAFNQKFFNAATNLYATGSQASDAVPLALGMVDPASRQAVMDNLAGDRNLNKGNTTVGEVCLEFLFKALAESGHSDLLYSMYNTDQSGYGLQVKLGKTTLTEAWNGDNGLSEHHSDDHFMFGEINEWFFSHLAGIQSDLDGPGFRKIVIKPAMVGDLTWVKATYGSISGDIVSNWTHGVSGLTLEVTIPVNTAATIYVPTAKADLVNEGGIPASRARGVKFLRMDEGAAVYAVGSGTYSFSSADSPVKPPGLTAAAGSSEVTLSWSPSANAQTYQLKRSIAAAAPVILANNIANTTFTDNGLVNGTTYTYTVSAENAFGQSEGVEVSATPAIIINSGFEVPIVSGFEKAPVGGGWTFSPTDGDNAAGITANHSGFTGGNPNAPEGEQAALLQGTGAISQKLSGFSPGQSYTLTFSAAQRANSNQAGETWQVKIDDQVIRDYAPDPTETNYKDYTAIFTASAVSQTLSFVGTNTRGGDNTVFIDQVRLQVK